MIVGIHQPQYLPWLGYFDKIDRSDKFVLLDNVQFKKNEWQNRNKIRTKTEWQWLTVPVLHDFGQKINEALINNKTSWRKKHLNALIYNYNRAPYFGEYISFFKNVYNREWLKLSDLNIYLIKEIMGLLDIRTNLHISSELNISGSKTMRLVSLCKTLKADYYLSGQDGPKYMDMELFKKEGIKVLIQDFKHPEYLQHCLKKRDSFRPFMSIIDLSI